MKSDLLSSIQTLDKLAQTFKTFCRVNLDKLMQFGAGYQLCPTIFDASTVSSTVGKLAVATMSDMERGIGEQVNSKVESCRANFPDMATVKNAQILCQTELQEQVLDNPNHEKIPNAITELVNIAQQLKTAGLYPTIRSKTVGGVSFCGLRLS